MPASDGLLFQDERIQCKVTRSEGTQIPESTVWNPEMTDFDRISYLFVIALDYALREVINGCEEELGFTIQGGADMSVLSQ